MTKIKDDSRRAYAKVVGEAGNINLSTSMFRRIIEDKCLYVDKTRFIEDFINSQSDIQLIARQRRLGKSLNLDTLRCFLTDKEDNRALFKGLYIESSPVWEQLNTWPCFLFDFKGLTAERYRKQVFSQVRSYLREYMDKNKLDEYLVDEVDEYLSAKTDDTTGLSLLAKIVYAATGKQSYVFIDEYDKLLMDNRDSDDYTVIQKYETALLSAIFKGNPHIKKGLMTGVTRISYEDMLSGLNNLETFDVFSDSTYTDDYGFTETEIDALGNIINFDKAELKSWYNGVRINETPIYNTYSVMSYLKNGNYDNYWGNSGTLDMIRNLLTPSRRQDIAGMMNGEPTAVQIDNRTSLRRMENDAAFYSLIVQAGYLSLLERIDESTSTVTIPNRELMLVWKRFILDNTNNRKMLVTMLDNISDLRQLEHDIQDYLTDSLSYHDIIGDVAEDRTKDGRKTKERAYHIFVLGLMSAYRDTHYSKPLSNRESGDGRYDVLFTRPECNYIFEFKSCTETDDLEEQAAAALEQIDEKRYFAEVPRDKPLIKIGMAFRGKYCEVCCGMKA